ncbi:MAG: transglycosylase SLT domain-containing protein [Mycobacteriaceae bacterium]|nr:transglycosylase SLT domain-containing protein [Mycobacteriaceae bacterium]
MSGSAAPDGLALLARGYQLYAHDPIPAPNVGRRNPTDVELATTLATARTDYALARHAARTLLDDALGDLAPAADTPLGRREELRRMLIRLRMQRQVIQRSRRQAFLYARRMRHLCYPRRTDRYIAAALHHLGITHPAAQRNWLVGYRTLIDRESSGRLDAQGPGQACGITQTTPTTFMHYHQPGTSTNIYDPVANICASMNYVMHRYGVAVTGENLTTLVQQADIRRTPRGY